MEHDNRGKVALWKGDGKNPKAPAYKGTVTAHRDIQEGEEVEIALWPNQSTNPKAPQVTGKVQDKYVREPQTGRGGAYDETHDIDDDIPF